MSADLIQDPLTDRVISESADANANVRHHAFGRDTTGNEVQINFHPIAVARLRLDDAATLIAFFF